MMDPSPASVIYAGTAPDNFFRKPYTATISFAAGLLLFLLPFAQLKCTSVTLAENTGIGIAIGEQWKVADLGEMSPFVPKNDMAKISKANPLKTGPNVFALVALAAGAAGLAFSLSSTNMRHVIGVSAGILAALMLIAVMVQFGLLLRSATDIKEGDSNFNMGVVVKIQFTLWYYLSLAAFATASFFSYKHHRIELEDALANHVDFEFQRKPDEHY
ncbi:MAG: hypothetical protein ABIR30_00960 [Chitinophagaceae bacterium]